MAGLLQHRLTGALPSVPSTSGRQQRRCACAAASDEPAEASKSKRSRLPAKGFFAEADTKAEVYSPLAGVSQANIYKRGGRYNPEFLWNTNWQDQLELEEAVARQQQEARDAGPAVVEGRLSLRRVADLNSMDVDLTEQLLRRSPPPDAAQPAAGAAAGAAPWQGRGGQSPDGAAQQRGPSRSSYPQMPPRRSESKRWERTDKFTRRAPAAAMSPTEAAAAAAKDAAERAAYTRYKQQLLLSTAGLGAAMTVATFALYSKDVGASYAVGALSSVVYLNMLNRSIDAVGIGGGGPGAGAVAAQPRLLIPIILAMGYNRWNLLAAENVGVTLQLLPMLLGFLTYKGAVIAKGALDLFGDLAGSERPSSDFAVADAAAGADAGGDGQAQSGDADEVIIGRDYANRILQG